MQLHLRLLTLLQDSKYNVNRGLRPADKEMR